MGLVIRDDAFIAFSRSSAGGRIVLPVIELRLTFCAGVRNDTGERIDKEAEMGNMRRYNKLGAPAVVGLRFQEEALN